jgi:aspartate-semialdehyde dehydrogenase
MTDKGKIVIAGAASLRGRELNEALGESVFSNTEIVLADDESQAGQLEAAGDEATLIQNIDDESFARADFAFFAGAQELTRKYWKRAHSAGASIVDLSSALEDVPGVLVAAPWLQDASAIQPKETVSLSTPAIIPAHPVAVTLALIMTRLQKLEGVRFASATVLEPASEHGRAAIDELHQQTVALLSFQSLPKEIYDQQVAFNVVPSFGDSKALGKGEALLHRHYHLIQGTHLADVGIQLLHVPVFHGTAISLEVELHAAMIPERVEAALHGEHIDIVAGTDAAPDNLRSAGQGEVLAQVRSQSEGNRPTNRFWIWATLDNLKVASLNAVACAMELRKLRPQGEVQ